MNVEHQEHYESLKIQPKEIWEQIFTKEELIAIYKANIIKYLLRKKGQDVKDMQKIQVYAKWLEEIYANSQDV